MQGKLVLKSIAAIMCFFFNVQCTKAQTFARIFEIQGTDSLSPFANKIIATTGIVTANFNGASQLRGYFIQDTVGDGNEITSDGLFIFDNDQNPDIMVGDVVRVTGTVKEYFKLTEITEVTSTEKVSSAIRFPKPVEVALPLSKQTWERYEGMLVHFNQELTVTENYYLGQYGEISLSANGRLYMPTQVIDPNDEFADGNSFEGFSNSLKISQEILNNNSNYITINDGSTKVNPSIIPYLSKDNSLRTGSRIKDLMGIVNFANNEYKIEPTNVPEITYADRPSVPYIAQATLKIASLNVLNFFNGNGSGGGFPTPRGALTLKEFERQKTKIVRAMEAIDADIMALMEIENDGDGPSSAIQELVNSLNENFGKELYKHVKDPKGSLGNSGEDAIKVAVIYKQNMVTPIGLALSDTNKIHNRPPMSQTFEDKDKRRFSIIVNHFKSKGCSGAKGMDADQKDGQSCFNAQRKLQSLALKDFVSKVQDLSQDEDVLLVGDFNSYHQEDPLDILREEGFVSITDSDYSYVFSRQSGSLDHAFVTPSLLPQMKGAKKWHINADEPRILDYTMKYKPLYLYSIDPHRFSDHDPVIIGLSLNEDAISSKTDSKFLQLSIHQNGRVIKYATSRAGIMNLLIYDFNGKQVAAFSEEIEIGEGCITLSSAIIEKPGLYLYKSILKSSNDSISMAGKLVIIE